MQLKQKLFYIVVSCVLLLSGAVLLINVMAQAPEKAQIVFQSDRDGSNEIYVMDTDGNNQRRLTNNLGHDQGPDWFDPAFAYVVSAVFPAGKLRGTWGWVKQSTR